MKRKIHTLKMIATAIAVAFVVYSCKNKISVSDAGFLAEVPFQTVDSMSIIQTEGGKTQMIVFANLMEKYDNDSLAYELFPKGVDIQTFTAEGELQSTLRADKARHEKEKETSKEVWMAFGHVVIKNILKQETMETDTIYWDRNKKQIYTDCYVRMYSKDGFMQGYGMTTDEKVTQSILHRPFNSYTVVVQDSTEIFIDSVNFIGPMPKKR